MKENYIYNMALVELPVSLGEALDKLTILDIKIDKIKNETKQTECKKEYDAILEKLSTYKNKYDFWYKLLKAVNAEIWDLQDIIRTSNEKKLELATIILDFNDMRFRIKNKLNHWSSSSLKEQKGYGARSILIKNNVSLVDIFEMQHILLYLSMDYDDVFLFSFPQIKHVYEGVFNNISNIHILEANEENIQKMYERNCAVIDIHEFHSKKQSESINKILQACRPNRGIIYPHPGLGDLINMIGSYHYFAEGLDELYITVYKKYFDAMKDFLKPNHKIRFLVSEIDHYSWLRLYEPIHQYFKVYKSGIFLNNDRRIQNIPDSFYEDMGLSPSIKFSHFHIPRSKESRLLYEKIKDASYIFVQQVYSGGVLPLVNWDINTTLTIDPNINVYQSGHTFYEIAQEFVNKPFTHYIDTIENASELHMVNSSFACLAQFLTLKAKIKKCIDRETMEEIKLF